MAADAASGWEMIVTHWFVALDGDDSNSGLDSGNAFRHVAHGVNRLDTGDTLFIGEGVYSHSTTGISRYLTIVTWMSASGSIWYWLVMSKPMR